MERCVNALKEWTGKARATIIYDSTVDEFTDDRLFDKIKGMPNVAIIGFTTDRDVFGGFYSVAVDKQDTNFFDPNIFAFSFESHGRCMTPQRFAVWEGLKQNAFVKFFDSSYGFVWFGMGGVGGFRLGNEKSDSYCWNMSRAFEGLENTTLTGMNGTYYHNPPFHHYSRLLAVKLEFSNAGRNTLNPQFSNFVSRNPPELFINCWKGKSQKCP